MMKGVLVALTIALFQITATAMIIDFKAPQEMKLQSGTTLLYWGAVYSQEDSPIPPFDPSYLEFFVRFRLKVPQTGSLQILVYEANYSNSVGHLESRAKNSVEYCCTQKLFEVDECDGVGLGEAIHRPDHKNVHLFSVDFDGNISVITQKINISASGVYLMQISNCLENGLGDVWMEGKAVWRNPYGYLPGDVAMLVPFSGIVALAHLGVFITYLVLSIKYFKILMKIQYGILGVILFSLVEISSWYFYRIGTNNTGYYSIAALVFVVLLSNIKKSLGRVLVLLVSMGFGIVKWTIGNTRVKIGLMAVFYYIFTFAYQLIKEMETLEKREIVSKWVTLGVVLPVAFLDTAFYFWIILSLIRTIQQLTLRRQILKLEMYKIFFGILVASGAFALLVIVYQGYLRISNTIVPWQNQWIFEAIWELIFFGILASICFLWRPRMNNSRYGYAEFFTEDKDEQEDDNSVPLQSVSVSGGEMKRRRKNEEKQSQKDQYDNSREANIQNTTVPIFEFEKEVVNFDLGDSDEDEEIETQIKKLD
eukprot:TRINITY_DN4796_c0_g4_i1.p1 TRINITY_DN4796_c0_g4~~TRINITY_DN4796_c0_g4_i1.p1  ORF type:complete len:536 (-),score=132.81 TRINITY_DN4796_c0_g4_i1:524-2131(-)